LSQLIEINLNERTKIMKKISSKLIIFFVALCFSITLCASIQAEEGMKIDLNNAGKEELMQLQKVGPQKAEAIIEYRETIGLFENPEDIMNVTGIGEATYEINKDLIAVTPPSSE
jgi:competence ComEA-like helix-hairpin-helix protein